MDELVDSPLATAVGGMEIQVDRVLPAAIGSPASRAGSVTSDHGLSGSFRICRGQYVDTPAGDSDLHALTAHTLTMTGAEGAGRIPPSGARAGPVRRWARGNPNDVIDVFVYVTVLNLAVEYVPSVISEGFTLSLLTAILLKVALELVLALKGRVVNRLRNATTPSGKVASVLLLWLVAAGSKLVVLELVNVVFGDAVSLGGFVSVTLLVITLLAARTAVRRLLENESERP